MMLILSDKYRSMYSSNIRISYFSGPFCEQDRDMCADSPCLILQNCTDVAAEVFISYITQFLSTANLENC